MVKFVDVDGFDILVNSDAVAYMRHPAYECNHEANYKMFYVAGCCDLFGEHLFNPLRVVGAPEEVEAKLNGGANPSVKAGSKPTIQLKITSKGVASRIAGRKGWNHHGSFEAAVASEATKLMRVEWVKEDEV